MKETQQERPSSQEGERGKARQIRQRPRDSGVGQVPAGGQVDERTLLGEQGRQQLRRGFTGLIVFARNSQKKGKGKIKNGNAKESYPRVHCSGGCGHNMHKGSRLELGAAGLAGGHTRQRVVTCWGSHRLMMRPAPSQTTRAQELQLAEGCQEEEGIQLPGHCRASEVRSAAAKQQGQGTGLLNT